MSRICRDTAVGATRPARGVAGRVLCGGIGLFTFTAPSRPRADPWRLIVVVV
jgi:hypothetical protein